LALDQPPDLILLDIMMPESDVFDALTSELSYKRAWSVAETLEYMRVQSGVSLDPGLLALFMESIPEVLEFPSHHAEPTAPYWVHWITSFAQSPVPDRL
jgi:response regulator RpfG family c-di-GMP phosphodiesterase